MSGNTSVIRFQSPQLPPLSEVAEYFAMSEQAGWFSNEGPCWHELSGRLAAYVGQDSGCVPVANATAGLMVALRAMTEGTFGREVIVPSFTFAASATAVMWAGFEPVFVDVEPDGWHLDADALRVALEERGDRVAAVLACSTFGTAPARELSRAWLEIAGTHGIPVLVDSAAGFGSEDDAGDPLGCQGDAEVFSFHATKPFAIGEGGAVVSRDPELLQRVRRLVNFGFTDGVVAGAPGINAKMSEVQAATGLAVTDRFAGILAARQSHAAALREQLAPLGYQFQAGSETSTWQFVPVMAPDGSSRDMVLDSARRHHVEIRTYFDPPLHTQPAFRHAVRAGSLGTTADLAARTLSLPMSNQQDDRVRDRIVTCLTEAIT